MKPRPSSALRLFVFLLFLLVPLAAAQAFTDKQVAEIYKLLDDKGDGKVDRLEFDINKVRALFWRDQPPGTELTFEQTALKREYFDKLDTNHDGKLSSFEMVDGLKFDDLDYGQKGYITKDDLRRFLTEVGR
jgi:Ca2+-binding EF-hand superfamily protein